MGDISPVRYNIKTEDVQFRSSVSEAVGNKMGGVMNFINTRQTDSKMWCINGNYYASFATIGVDGVYICPVDMEVYAVSMYNLVPGSSGLIEFDLKRHTASGQAGASIFSARPALSYLSGINSFLAKRFFDNVILQNPAGCVQPVLAISQFNAGDMITCNITSTQVDGQSAGIILDVRPR